jgi:Thymidine kinase
MAQLYFKYGTMNSGKSIEILKVAHNYEEQGKPVVIMTSALDNRDEIGVVSSRIGIREQAVPIDATLDVFDYVTKLPQKPYCILIDEAQFLRQKKYL